MKHEREGGLVLCFGPSILDKGGVVKGQEAQFCTLFFLFLGQRYNQRRLKFLLLGTSSGITIYSAA